MIVADTGAVIALIDVADEHHDAVREIYDEDPKSWVLPWAILPEVDYLLATHVGRVSRDAFLDDLATGAFAIEWGQPDDVRRAHALHTKYRRLTLGLVDGIVMATAERLEATAIATLDLRHFGAVKLAGSPQLYPRDR